jgi:hypothetical protein
MKNMKNTVSLEELEFQKIHKVINYKNSQGEDKQITIFNLDQEQEQELLTKLMKYGNMENDEVKFNVPATEVISTVLPYYCDLEMPQDIETVERIINNPNPILKEIILEVTQLLTKVMEVNFKSMQITKSTLEKIGYDDEKLIELTQKTKEIQELTVLAEKEKQETEKIKAQNNEEEVRKLAQELHAEKTKNLELQVKLEENGIQPEKKKRGRPRKIKEGESLD